MDLRGVYLIQPWRTLRRSRLTNEALTRVFHQGPQQSRRCIKTVCRASVLHLATSSQTEFRKTVGRLDNWGSPCRGCRKTLDTTISSVFALIWEPIYPSENFCVDCRASYEVAFRESNSQVSRGVFFYSLNIPVQPPAACSASAWNRRSVGRLALPYQLHASMSLPSKFLA